MHIDYKNFEASRNGQHNPKWVEKQFPMIKIFVGNIFRSSTFPTFYVNTVISVPFFTEEN